MAASSIALLQELATPKTCVTFAELRRRLGWNPRRTRAAIAALKSQEAIDAVRLDCFRCNKNGRAMLKAAEELAARPRKPATHRPADPKSLRARIWRALRMMGKTTIPELMAICGTEAEQAAPDKLRHSVSTYLANLCTGGYLQRLPKRDKSAGGQRGNVRYFLLPDKNTGPLSPRIGVKGAVYDANRGEVTWSPAGAR